MIKKSRDGELRSRLAEVFGDEAWGVGVDEDLMCALDLDSLAVLRLLATVEKRFDMRFPNDQLGDIRTLRQLLHLIETN